MIQTDLTKSEKASIFLLEHKLMKARAVAEKLTLNGYEMRGISHEVRTMPIISDVPEKTIVPIGTASEPRGLSATEADFVVFFNNKDTRVWYTSTSFLRDYIGQNKDKLVFGLENEEYKTICVTLSTGDLAQFSQIPTTIHM